MENSHGNCVNPPRSATIDGTAVARIVESIAMRPVASITEMSTGPRAERNPTAVVSVTFLLGGAGALKPAHVQQRRWPRFIPRMPRLTAIGGGKPGYRNELAGSSACSGGDCPLPSDS